MDNMGQETARQAQGLATRLATLSRALTEVDTLSKAERLQLLAAWEYVGARYRTIHALLTASLIQRRRPSSGSANDALLTVPEVAARLRVVPSRVYQLIRAKSLPSVTIGERQVRVRRSAVQAYLERKEQQS
jgi:excisionase family DNA binding protein